jgi:hypothetical protein
VDAMGVESGAWPAAPRPPQNFVERAGLSSLPAIAWGLAYPDLWRFLSIYHAHEPYLDRGWAMQQTWAARLSANHRLATWGAATLRGRVPAVIFNATVAETGERFVLSSLRLNPLLGECPKPRDPACADGVAARTLAGYFPAGDIDVSTAVRLSATFPFVSPIARPWLEGRGSKRYHVADGGYYDNFGVLSAVEWIRRIMEMDPKARGRMIPHRILLVEIRAGDYRADTVAAPRERAGWVYATLGPILTLMEVRTSAQVSRNNLDVRMLRELATEHHFSFESAVFPLLGSAPLSWHLSQSDRDGIRAAWERCSEAESTDASFYSPIRDGLDIVHRFFGEAVPGSMQRTAETTDRSQADAAARQGLCLVPRSGPPMLDKTTGAPG